MYKALMTVQNIYTPNRITYNSNVNTYFFDFEVNDANQVNVSLIDKQGYAVQMSYIVNVENKSITFSNVCPDACLVIIERRSNVLQSQSFPCNKQFEDALDNQIMIMQELEEEMRLLELQRIKKWCAGCDISGGQHDDGIVIKDGKVTFQHLPHFPIIPDIALAKEGDVLSLAIPEKDVYCFRQPYPNIPVSEVEQEIKNSVDVHYVQFGDLVSRIGADIKVHDDATLSMTDWIFSLGSAINSAPNDTISRILATSSPNWIEPITLNPSDLKPSGVQFHVANGIGTKDGILIKSTKLNGLTFKLDFSQLDNRGILFTSGKYLTEVRQSSMDINLGTQYNSSTGTSYLSWDTASSWAAHNPKRMFYEATFNYHGDHGDITINGPHAVTYSPQGYSSNGEVYHDQTLTFYFSGTSAGTFFGDASYITDGTMTLHLHDILTSSSAMTNTLFVVGETKPVIGYVNGQLIYRDGSSKIIGNLKDVQFVIQGDTDYLLLSNFGSYQRNQTVPFSLNFVKSKVITVSGLSNPLSELVLKLGNPINLDTVTTDLMTSVTNLIPAITNAHDDTATLTQKSNSTDIIKFPDLTSMPTSFRVMTDGTVKGNNTFLIIKSGKLENSKFTLNTQYVGTKIINFFAGSIQNGHIHHTLYVQNFHTGSERPVIGLSGNNIYFADGSHETFMNNDTISFVIRGSTDFLVLGNLQSTNVVEEPITFNIIWSIPTKASTLNKLPVYFQISDFVNSTSTLRNDLELTDLKTVLNSIRLLPDTATSLTYKCTNAYQLPVNLHNTDLCNLVLGDTEPIRFGVNVLNGTGRNHAVIIYKPHTSLNYLQFILKTNVIDHKDLIVTAGRLDKDGNITYTLYLDSDIPVAPPSGTTIEDAVKNLKQVKGIKDDHIIYIDDTTHTVPNNTEIKFKIVGETDFLIIGNLSSNTKGTVITKPEDINNCANTNIDKTTTPTPCVTCSPLEPSKDVDELYPARCDSYQCSEQNGVLYFTIDIVKEFLSKGLPLSSTLDSGKLGILGFGNNFEWSAIQLPPHVDGTQEGEYLTVLNGKYVIKQLTLPNPQNQPNYAIPVAHNGKIYLETPQLLPDPTGFTDQLLSTAAGRYVFTPNLSNSIPGGKSGQILGVGSNNTYEFLNNSALPDPTWQPDYLVIESIGGHYQLTNINPLHPDYGNVGDLYTVQNGKWVWSPTIRDNQYDFILSKGVVQGLQVYALNDDTVQVTEGFGYFPDDGNNASQIVHFSGGTLDTLDGVFLNRDGSLSNSDNGGIDLRLQHRIELAHLAQEINNKIFPHTSVTLSSKDATHFKLNGGYVVRNNLSNLPPLDPALFRFIDSSNNVSAVQDTLSTNCLVELGLGRLSVIPKDQYATYKVFILENGDVYLEYGNRLWTRLQDIQINNTTTNTFLNTFGIYTGTIVVQNNQIVGIYNKDDVNLSATLQTGLRDNEIYVLHNNTLTPSGVTLEDFTKQLAEEHLILIQQILDKQLVELQGDKWSGNTIFDNYINAGSYINQSDDATILDKDANHLRIADLVALDTPRGIEITPTTEPLGVVLQPNQIIYTWATANKWIDKPLLSNISYNPIHLSLDAGTVNSYVIINQPHYQPNLKGLTFKFQATNSAGTTVKLYAGNVSSKYLKLSDVVTHDTPSGTNLTSIINTPVNLIPTLQSMADDTLNYTYHTTDTWTAKPNFTNISANPIRVSLTTSSSNGTLTGDSSFVVFKKPKNLPAFALNINAVDFNNKFSVACYAGRINVIPASTLHRSVADIVTKDISNGWSLPTIDNRDFTIGNVFATDYAEVLRKLDNSTISYTYPDTNDWNAKPVLTNTSSNPITFSFNSQHPAGHMVYMKNDTWASTKFVFKFSTTSTTPLRLTVISGLPVLGNRLVRYKAIKELVTQDAPIQHIEDDNTLQTLFTVANNMANDYVSGVFTGINRWSEVPQLSNISKPIRLTSISGKEHIAIFKQRSLSGKTFKFKVTGDINAKLICKAGRIIQTRGSGELSLGDLVRNINTTVVDATPSGDPIAKLVELAINAPNDSVTFTKNANDNWNFKPTLTTRPILTKVSVNS